MQKFNAKFKNDLLQRCYVFGLNVIELTDRLSQKTSAQVIARQLIRSATSVGANLIEGQAASSRLEFKKFNEISLKSANESLYWLNLLEDSRLLSAEKVVPIKKEIEEIAKMLASGILKLKGKKL